MVKVTKSFLQCSQVGMRSFLYLLTLLSSHICGRVPYSGKLSREKTFTNW